MSHCIVSPLFPSFPSECEMDENQIAAQAAELIDITEKCCFHLVLFLLDVMNDKTVIVDSENEDHINILQTSLIFLNENYA